ncbi:MAG: maleylpyruvate isomerase family mycothiol-dependent enzyme [SAR202 cluster bacterium]|nr:maleylpyruvate isomerase family mycothiol-dependent enzyme [SAR202 cluster bacterium]|tara:strand:- start:12345 stop:12947 length:603 start_codon:yes stop_codon:yes gene_type:complete
MKSAYIDSVESFLEVIRQIDPNQWDANALDQWSFRDLVGHTGRSIKLVKEFGSQRSESLDVQSAALHYQISLSPEGANQRVAAGGVEAGNALGEEPVHHLQEAWIATQETLHSTEEDTVISYVNGGIKFGDYLRTRILELVVHSIDLAQAIGIDYEPPKEAMREALYLLADLAVDTPYASKLALISTGREISKTSFNVIG